LLNDTFQSTDAVVTALTTKNELENELENIKQEKVEMEAEFNQVLEARVKEHEE